MDFQLCNSIPTHPPPSATQTVNLRNFEFGSTGVDNEQPQGYASVDFGFISLLRIIPFSFFLTRNQRSDRFSSHMNLI